MTPSAKSISTLPDRRLEAVWAKNGEPATTLSVVGSPMVDVENRSRVIPNRICLTFPDQVQTPMDLGIMMVAADVVDRFHEAIEFIAVDGKRLAEPHPDPANGDSEAMEWMADHFLALVKDYARRYPVGCSTKFLPAETASSREDWDDDDEQSRLHDFASRISLRPDTSLDLDSTYAEPDVFHLSLVGPVERDAYHPSREFPGTIDLEFPGRLTTVHQLARALVVADVCNAFHASMEFTSVTATGERVADPHPGGANSKQEFLMWSWLVGHVDAIVGAYQEQFPA